jgi:parallel beta-helix repeat protein
LKYFAVVLALVAVLAFSSVAMAVVYVNGSSAGAVTDGQSWATAFHSVQAGLDAATGGEVWVATATYEECVTLKAGVALYGGFSGSETLRDQRNKKLNTTILDGHGAGSVVTVPEGAGPETRIDGFTIRGGTGTLVEDYYLMGAGIYSRNASPTIFNNSIIGNVIVNYNGGGGGIYCFGGSPVIENNEFSGNVATQSGGGILCEWTSARIRNNTFRRNTADDGAAVACGNGSNDICGNTVTDNLGSAWDGSIACGGHDTIMNNIISRNAAGGIRCYDSIVANNVIVGNASPAIYSQGAGVIVNNTVVGNSQGIFLDRYVVRVSNNIVAHNGTGIYAPGLPWNLQMTNNCVYNNATYNYMGIEAGEGDISVEPMLASREFGDVHLQPGSPCRDAGDDSVVDAAWTDIDGNARAVGGRVDIGADEFDGTVSMATPRIVRVCPRGNDLNDGSTWKLAKRTVQAAIDDAQQGGEIWVAEGLYKEHITLRPFVYAYGGFKGNEKDRSRTDPAKNAAILDGEHQLGPVVTLGLSHLVSAIDGFTIRNGYSGYGGGIHCREASTYIRNNTITGNLASNGGGINCEDSAPVITDNRLEGNTAQDGAGIYTRGVGGIISDNTVLRNKAEYDGEAICCYSQGITISNNTVVGNDGKGIYAPWPAVVTGNSVTDNSGDGIYASGVVSRNTVIGNDVGISSGAPVVITDNLVVNNWFGILTVGDASIINNTVVGGENGIVFWQGSPTVANNIVAYTSVGLTPTVMPDQMPVLSHNDFYANGINYDGPFDHSTDISADPRFANRAGGDYHLKTGSACIDAGSNSASGLPNYDIDGQNRIGGGTVDIGADEYWRGRN